MGAPGFWDDQAAAARISQEHARVTRKLDRYERLEREYSDLAEMMNQDVFEDEEEAESRSARWRGSSRACRRTRSSTASTTAATPSSRSTPARAAPTRRTGRR